MSFPYASAPPIIKQNQFKNKTLEMVMNLSLDKNTKFILRKMFKDYNVIGVEHSGEEDFLHENKFYKYRIIYEGRNEHHVRYLPFEFYFNTTENNHST